MPELPEVETVVRALDRALSGRTVMGTRLLGRMRVPFDAATADKRLRGRAVVRVRRRAKFIVIECSGPTGILAHLGMTGSFRVERSRTPPHKHDRAVIVLDNGDELRYRDARRFGFIKPVDIDEFGADPAELRGLGPEPLSRGFTGRTLHSRAARRTTPVKALLMDQGVVAGVGNIYASEALHAAGIDPRRPAADLDGDEWARVAAEVKAVLRKSIGKGGSTIRSYRGVDGAEGGFQLSLKVYGKRGEACPRCRGTIEAIRQGGRSTFFCRHCQR